LKVTLVERILMQSANIRNHKHTGRILMQYMAYGAVLGVMLAATPTALAQTPSWTPPPENQRCPSKWGAGDERGSANHMKPQTVLNAVKLIKTGEVIELGHVLNTSMPFLAHGASTCTSNAHS
jgi:hypothetical protein